MSIPNWNNKQSYSLGMIVFYSSVSVAPSLWTYNSSVKSVVGVPPDATKWLVSSVPSLGITSVSTTNGWGTLVSVSGNRVSLIQPPITSYYNAVYFPTTFLSSNNTLVEIYTVYGSFGTVINGSYTIYALGSGVNTYYTDIVASLTIYSGTANQSVIINSRFSIPNGFTLSSTPTYFSVPYSFVIPPSLISANTSSTSVLSLSSSGLPVSGITYQIMPPQISSISIN